MTVSGSMVSHSKALVETSLSASVLVPSLIAETQYMTLTTLKKEKFNLGQSL